MTSTAWSRLRDAQEEVSGVGSERAGPGRSSIPGPADRSANYGVTKFYEMFNDRQLLVHLTTLQVIIDYPWNEVKDEKKREALRYAFNWPSKKRLTTTHSNRDWMLLGLW
jgi:adenine-specific DNA methylase